MLDILDKQNICAPNIKYYQKYESDLIAVSKSQLVTEFEIKRTYTDFEADFTKGRKGRWPTNKHRDISNGKLSNYFYFVCQPHVIPIDKVPEHAGLIYIYNNAIYVQKQAPRLHNRKIDTKSILKICRSLGWKFLKYKK